jgi:predicted SnoaL-like aldol condensation-catalyzing enzyme
MSLRGSAASSAQPTPRLRAAFKDLPAGVALAVMMLIGHGAVAESAGASVAEPQGEKVNHLSHRACAQAEKNKQLVLTAYQGLFGDHDLTVIDKYWAKDYIQHNPYMADGRDSVRAYVIKLGIENWPKTRVRFLRVAAEGDLVFIQTVQPRTEQSPEMVIVDIFRVADGKLAEHWDTMQAVPADATNPRPMY